MAGNISAEMLQKTAILEEAVRRGVRRALLDHARNNNPVCFWRDEKIVWLSPQQVFEELGVLPPLDFVPANPLNPPPTADPPSSVAGPIS